MGSLLREGELADQTVRLAPLVHVVKHGTDVDADAALEVGLKLDVTAHRLPIAVKGETDQVSLAIEDGAAGVAAGDVVSL